MGLYKDINADNYIIPIDNQIKNLVRIMDIFPFSSIMFHVYLCPFCLGMSRFAILADRGVTVNTGTHHCRLELEGPQGLPKKLPSGKLT